MLKTTFILTLTVRSQKPVSAHKLKAVLEHSTAREAIETGLQDEAVVAAVVFGRPTLLSEEASRLARMMVQTTKEGS